jgi:hypothetical protein
LSCYQLAFAMAIKVTLTMKLDVEKFNGMNDFNLWRIRLHNLLVQQGLFKVLKGIDCLPKRMDDKDKKKISWNKHLVQFSCVCLMRL